MRKSSKIYTIVLNEIEQIDEKLKLLNTYPKKYNIGNYTFSIEKEGIYYKSLYKKSKHKIFAELDSIKGGPMSLLKKNYSNFLVAKNIRFSKQVLLFF